MEKGSITKGKAQCTQYEVKINVKSPALVLTSSFAAAIKQIDLASNRKEELEGAKVLFVSPVQLMSNISNRGLCTNHVDK